MNMNKPSIVPQFNSGTSLRPRTAKIVKGEVPLKLIKFEQIKTRLIIECPSLGKTLQYLASFAAKCRLNFLSYP